MLGLGRSTYYRVPAGESAENLALMRLIDEQYTACPFYGSRRMTEWLTNQGLDPSASAEVLVEFERSGRWP